MTEISQLKPTMMLEQLLLYIKSFSNEDMTPAQIHLFTQTCTFKKLLKRQYLLQEGDVSIYWAFIIKGAMRQFSVCERGSEYVVTMGIENWWMVDRESHIQGTPSIYNIQAVEDTQLILLTRADILMLMKQVPAWEKAVYLMYEQHAIAIQKRLHACISQNSERRYEDFVKSNPDFVQRFTLLNIASYLGIAKETLSRIRRAPFKNDFDRIGRNIIRVA